MKLPVAPAETTWKASAAQTRLLGEPPDWKQYASGHLYTDPEADAATKEAYKLPFADVIDGKVTIVPKALEAIAAALAGARGGVDIPDAALPAIKKQLSALYKQAKMDQPESLKRGMESGDYVLPDQMTTETAPPVAIAAMGPVALTFFVSIYNAHTTAGVPLPTALERAWCSMYGAGFCRQPDGTYRRAEDWEEREAKWAEYSETKGVMRAGKTLSAASAGVVRRVCRGITAHAGELQSFLESCGCGMEDDTEESEQITRSIEGAEVQIIRSSPTGSDFTCWAVVSTKADGSPAVDDHNTIFPTEEIQRAMDDLGNHGQRLVLRPTDHSKGGSTGYAVEALTVTRALRDALDKEPGKTGLLVRYKTTDPDVQALVRSGKYKVSLEGTGVLCDK